MWTYEFAEKLYSELSKKSVYITNLAKCTQNNAHSVKDIVFRSYLSNTLKEIDKINPKNIISFGNQVSSILLNKKIKVSDYTKKQKEILKLNNKSFDVYPSYYPVGQGMRNIKKAIIRLKNIID
jgi:DNA polymerase